MCFFFFCSGTKRSTFVLHTYVWKQQEYKRHKVSDCHKNQQKVHWQWASVTVSTWSVLMQNKPHPPGSLCRIKQTSGLICNFWSRAGGEWIRERQLSHSDRWALFHFLFQHNDFQHISLDYKRKEFNTELSSVRQSRTWRVLSVFWFSLLFYLLFGFNLIYLSV